MKGENGRLRKQECFSSLLFSFTLCSESSQLHTPCLATTKVGSFPDMAVHSHITQRTWSRIAIHKLTKKLHLNTEKSQCTNTQHKDPERYWIFRAKRSIKTSPNLIYFSQLCSAFYIPLTPVIVKKVSRYTTTQLYSPTMWTEPDLGSISHKV